MIKPDHPENEAERLAAVESYTILDTPEHSDFDEITALAAQITDCPISLMTLLDTKRNWFKSHYGTEIKEDPRNRSFCGHAINSPREPFIVPNALKDIRFEDNPLVIGETNIRFYAGFPIVNKEGFPLGTLCVMDTSPKQLEKRQIGIMKTLSNQSLVLMERHKKERQLRNLNNELIEVNKNLKEFARVAAHDLRSPIVNIKDFAKLLNERLKISKGDKAEKMLEMISSSAEQLKEMIDGMLEYSRNAKVLENSQKALQISEVIEYCVKLVDPKEKHQFNYPNDFQLIKSNEIALKRIFINLFNNAIQFSPHKKATINIHYEEKGNFYEFSVSDDGYGIHKDFIEKVFDIYQRGTDIQTQKGIGIGLTTVKKLVSGLGGSIEVRNQENSGALFLFSLPK